MKRRLPGSAKGSAESVVETGAKSPEHRLSKPEEYAGSSPAQGINGSTRKGVETVDLDAAGSSPAGIIDEEDDEVRCVHCRGLADHFLDGWHCENGCF